MATFPFTNRISQASSSRQLDQNMVVQKYADGYEQRFSFGRNSLAYIMQISLVGLNESDRNILATFYHTHGKVKAFEMQAPNDSVTRSWVFDSPLSETNNANLYFFTFTIREVFE